MCFGSQPDNGASQMRADQLQREQRLNAARTQVNQTFSQFDDNFFKQRGKAHFDYYAPQLDDQFTDAQKQLTYALSRSGNLNSSVAEDRFARLGSELARNRQGIAGGAMDYENSVRRDVEGNRGDVLGQLASANDADAAGATAMARARLLSQQPSFSPLGALFTNLTGVAAQRRANSDAMGYSPSFGANLFGARPASYTVGG